MPEEETKTKKKRRKTKKKRKKKVQELFCCGETARTALGTALVCVKRALGSSSTHNFYRTINQVRYALTTPDNTSTTAPTPRPTPLRSAVFARTSSLVFCRGRGVGLGFKYRYETPPPFVITTTATHLCVTCTLAQHRIQHIPLDTYHRRQGDGQGKSAQNSSGRQNRPDRHYGTRSGWRKTSKDENTEREKIPQRDKSLCMGSPSCPGPKNKEPSPRRSWICQVTMPPLPPRPALAVSVPLYISLAETRA